MRRTARDGGFWLCLLFNLLLNFEWSLPAWLLLVLHFVLELSLLWFWLALALWFLLILGTTGLISWAAGGAPADPPHENKNPYSAKDPRSE